MAINLMVQRKDRSLFVCDMKGAVIAHFPNILNTKNQRDLLNAVRVFLKEWIKQLDKQKGLEEIGEEDADTTKVPAQEATKQS